MISDSNYCPAVWKTLSLDRHNEDKISVAPCCQAEHRLTNAADFDFANDPWLQEIRLSFLRGEQPQSCRACWDAERAGKISRRLTEQQYYGSKPNYEIELKGLDYTVTWACNSACIMCEPRNSSMWANELGFSSHQLRELGRSFQKQNPYLDKVPLENLRMIHFNGGEPFLNRDALDFLKRVVDVTPREEVRLSYNTNGTIFPNPELIDLWAEMRSVRIMFSIDAVGDAFDYVRWPGRWDQVDANITKMIRTMPGSVVWSINATVGCYNIADLEALTRWFDQRFAECDPSAHFMWQIAYNFHPGTINELAKHALRERYADHHVWKYILGYLDAADRDDSWIEKLETIDQRRGTDWTQALSISKYYLES